jgi:hypothetical protein
MWEKTSAGRLWQPGFREGNSFRGANAADWAAEKIASPQIYAFGHATRSTTVPVCRS